ncbi:glycine cleavage system protein H [Aerococcus urinaeequi]|jgi:glycine cleavage system H protein|uniref:glycine cleavage system protein H n=1 Tax=Aerococcus urinaeequi TaxID=51665 RepID=UPI003D6C0D20
MRKVFTETGLWLKEVESGKVRIGLSPKGQDELGEVSFFDPFNIETVKKGDSFCSIEAAKAVTEMDAPVSGKIITFNEELLSAPENLNEEEDALNWILEVSTENFDKEDYLKEDLPIEE